MTTIDKALEIVDDGAAGAILGVIVEDASRYGTLAFAEEDGRLRSFSEKRKGLGVINAGIYVLRKSTLKAYDTGQRPLSIETDVFPAMLVAGEDMRVVPTVGEFIDIGTEGTLTLASKFVTRHFKDKTYIGMKFRET